jgi:uncharacterized membrane-anchored protein
VKPLSRGIALGVLQCLLVLSVAGKYAWDREHLPRVWLKTAPVDPNLPIRGRYVSLRLVPSGMVTAAHAVAYFIPEHARDVTRLRPGEELWVEVSVPPAGAPRPLRLGVKRDGVLTPLVLR